MRATLFSISAFAGLAAANISFTWVQPTCEFSSIEPSRCLTGQHCTERNTCAANSKSDHSKIASRSRSSIRFPEKRQNVQYSTDGKCGPANGNLLCDPKSTTYTGSCCSSYGWCGNTPAHCGDGCLSGCNNGAQPSSAQPVATPTTTPNAPGPRDDGRCGKDFGGATCDAKGAYGGCCSSYGYCGSTDGHCLVANMCQSGCKDNAPVSSAPAPTSAVTRPPSATTSGEPVLGKPSSVVDTKPTGVPTVDGSCGAKFGGTVCGNWAQGSCCSMYGYCGNTTSHCGEGCQNGPCDKAPSQPAPAASPAPRAQTPGSIEIKGRSGVPAMHAGLMPNGRVVFLDKVENYTELKLGNGQYAYSSEYDPVTQKLVPLAYKTNAFCSGGIFLADGRFASLGGNAPLDFIDPTVGDGFRAIRFLERSDDGSLNGQDWVEPGTHMDTARWYASVQIMPDNTIFVASGSLNGLDPSKPENNNPTYEILNADGTPQGKSIDMEILKKNQPYYMYPFMHLMKDGNLFVQVAKSAEIFNVDTGNVVRQFADLPGSHRTYPNTGGSVMMPLSSKNDWNPDVIICGGGPYQDITAPGDASCGRIRPLDANPEWEMDSMPEGRGMVEGTLLPDGTVVWVNGAQLGAQGFGVAEDPALEVLLYDPDQPKGKRWTTGPTSTIARMYHSVALLLLDGTLLISGSNPVEQPILKADAKNPFVTEFRNEIYTPAYLQGNPTRPSNVQLSSKDLKADGSTFTINFTAPANSKNVKVSLYYGGFVTHSLHMGHRMAFLDTTGFQADSTSQTITVTMPLIGVYKIISWKLLTSATPNGQKISVFLEELGISYKTTSIGLGKDGQKSQNSPNTNPNGRIPAIIDHSRNFATHSLSLNPAQSSPISSPTTTKDSKFSFRNDTMALFFQNAGVRPMQGQANRFFRYPPERIPYGITRYQNETGRLCLVLEARLQGWEYLVGGKYSVAHISTFTWVRWAPWAGIEFDEFPRLKGWCEKIGERDAVRRGLMVPSGEDNPTAQLFSVQLSNKLQT
ncbi:glyoxal oxidase N-terminus-domain-containing protein [Phaeosphaeriaceae sp. PMI808]|nr:glyoxal oxidase N-terminus-domain-containing protein [Phaeosphaeriaceae sp. PMI808]